MIARSLRILILGVGESMFARQSEMLMPEEELGSQSPVSYKEDFEDLSSNADLYVFNHQMK